MAKSIRSEKVLKIRFAPKEHQIKSVRAFSDEKNEPFAKVEDNLLIRTCQS